MMSLVVFTMFVDSFESQYAKGTDKSISKTIQFPDVNI